MAFVLPRTTTTISAGVTPPGSSGNMASPLACISEDGNEPFVGSPRLPPRAYNRSYNRQFKHRTPRYHADRSPPEYSYFEWVDWDDPAMKDSNPEKLAALRRNLNNNRYISTRGGWKRLCLILLILLSVIVALAVGLAVGLQHHSSSKSTTTSPVTTTPAGAGTGTGAGGTGGASGSVGGTSTTPASNETFPAGSYSIDTFLDTVAANCTSNPDTWMCYPYSTYAESRSLSDATFQWIINPIENSPNYTISSTSNVFSILFTNATMYMLDSGLETEHYFFQVEMDKITKPSVALSLSGDAATCTFSGTTFQAYLYTKTPKTYPTTSTSTSNSTAAYAPWPYAVKVEQVVGAGTNEPTCVDDSGASLGDFTVQDGTQLCDCLYLNTGN